MRPVRWFMILGVVLCGWAAALSLSPRVATIPDRNHLHQPEHPFAVWINGSGLPVAIEQPRVRVGGTGPDTQEGLTLRSTGVVRELAWDGSVGEHAHKRSAGDASHGRWTRGPPQMGA